MKRIEKQDEDKMTQLLKEQIQQKTTILITVRETELTAAMRKLKISTQPIYCLLSCHCVHL